MQNDLHHNTDEPMSRVSHLPAKKPVVNTQANKSHVYDPTGTSGLPLKK
jgi:hypothetical protein